MKPGSSRSAALLPPGDERALPGSDEYLGRSSVEEEEEEEEGLGVWLLFIKAAPFLAACCSLVKSAGPNNVGPLDCRTKGGTAPLPSRTFEVGSLEKIRVRE